MLDVGWAWHAGLALVLTAIAVGFWAAGLRLLTKADRPRRGEASLRIVIGLVAMAGAAGAILIPLLSGAAGDATELFAVSAVVLAVIALTLVIWSVRTLLQLSLDNNSQPHFSSALSLLFAGLGVGLASAIVAVPGHLWEHSESVSRQDWFRDNFEIFIVVVGVLIIGFGDWLGRGWQRSAENPSEEAVRGTLVSSYSLIFACAVSVSLLISIGSNAFAARLAQQQIEARRDQTPVARERIQRAVSDLSRLRDRIASEENAKENARDRYQALFRQTSRIRLEQYATQAEFWTGASELETRLPPDAPITISELQQQANFSNASAAAIRFLRGARAEPARISELTALRAHALGLNESAATLSANTMLQQNNIAQLIQNVTLLEREQQCIVDRLGWAIQISVVQPDEGQTVTQGEGAGTSALVEPSQQAATTEPGQNESATSTNAVTTCLLTFRDQPMREYVGNAQSLIDAASPLERSWMSSLLARRAPIMLSIELVLVMGALGALMRVASVRLREITRIAVQPEATFADSTPMEDALLTLALNVVFGMATALALFILMSVTINASSMHYNAEANLGDDLNPFTMAAFGLLGGFSALNVANWMDGLTRDLLKPKEGEGPDPEPNGGAQGGAQTPAATDTAADDTTATQAATDIDQAGANARAERAAQRERYHLRDNDA